MNKPETNRKSGYQWICHWDRWSDKIYYEANEKSYYHEKGDTQWERPSAIDGEIKPHWIGNFDLKSGRLYFEDIDTRMVIWDKPNEFYDDKHKWFAKKDINSDKYYYENMNTQQTQWEIPICFQTKLENEWLRHFHIKTDKYYYENLNTGHITWDKPNNIQFDDNGIQIIAKLRRRPLFLDEEDYILMIDLVTGYIKESFLKFDQYRYPSVLTNVFIQFIGDMFVRFDVYPNQYKVLIKNNGKMIDKHSSWNHCSFTVGCSNGWNSGIHKIRIKCKAFGAVPVIGITSNYNQYINDGFWCTETDGFLYGYYSPNMINKSGVISNKYLPQLTKGCIVTLIVNCNQWKLTVFIKQQNQTISIQPNKTYYFFMGIQSHYSQYQLLRS